MTTEAGRLAIETYWITAWGSTTPYGLSGQPFIVAAPSVRLTIIEGARRQGTIGRGQNVVNIDGTVMLSIFTDGALGDAPGNVLADAIIDLFHNKTLDAAGAVLTTPGQSALVRFSPPELGADSHPYTSGRFKDPPYNMINVIAPFVRYELR